MFLFYNEGNVVIYVLKAILLSFMVTLIPVLFLDYFFTLSNMSSPNQVINLIDIFGMIIFSPIFETLIISFFVYILKHFIENILYTSIIIALFFAIIHSIIVDLWGYVIFSTFIIYSISYQVWYLKSKKHAFFISSSIHSGVNMISVVAIIC